MLMTRRFAIGTGAVAGAALAHGASCAAQPPATAQAPAFFRYRVGDMQVTAINDGMAYRSLDGFIPNASPEAVRQALADNFLPTDRFPITFNTLVINTGGKLVLIDTGNGDLAAPTSGTWMSNFRAAGFDPARVDVVLFSHFHTDHINGYRLKDGTAVFPQAEVMVPAPEWDYWMSDDKRSQAPDGLRPNFDNVRRVFGPIAANVTRYEWDREVLPGITSVEAAGHTPGHTCFAVVSGRDKLLVMSDVTNNTLIFARHPNWSAVFDQDAAGARATRHRMLDIAATERMQVSFYHAPFPATGHIVREGDGYALAPVVWTPAA